MAHAQQIIANLPTPLTTGKVALVAGVAVEDNIPGHTAAAAVVHNRTVLGGGIGASIIAVVSPGTVSGHKVTFTSSDNTETSQLFFFMSG